MSFAFGPAGGIGGSAFDAPFATRSTAQRPRFISAMKGRSGNRIAQIQVVWGIGGESPAYGGEGGTPFQFDIPVGEELTQIVGSVGDYNSVRLFSIQFITNMGTESPVYGKPTSTTFRFQCPPNSVISGIFGRSGREVDALGVYIDPI